jgi:3-phosphoshikimate 1-carboxyvinyltransferase
MVAPHAKSPLTVKLKGAAGSKPFVTMTEEMLKQFAGSPTGYDIEGDASAASYFLALPVVACGELTFTNYGGRLQGDRKFSEVISEVARSRRGVDQNFREFSDTFLTLAAIAPLLDGPTKITGIAHTRKQETDRVAGMARELRKLGQEVIETEDALEIHPRPLVSGVEIETYHDHRFAMSFGILGCHNLHGDGRPWLTIKDPACCAKTFPAFFEALETLRVGSL